MDDLERPRRDGVGQDPEVGLVVDDRLDDLVRMQALEQHPRLRIRRLERLHVPAHVVQADRVDRGDPDRAVDALPGGLDLGARLLEVLQQRSARLVEEPPLLGRHGAGAGSGRAAPRPGRSRAAGSDWLAADWDIPCAAAPREKLRRRTTSQ